MISGTMLGEAPPAVAPDFLADGPASGWAAAAAHVRKAAAPDVLAGKYKFPFGEMPGEPAPGVIVADPVVHARDLAKAMGQDSGIDGDLADRALATWHVVLPAEGRDGNGFKDAVPVAAGASSLDRLVAYTGRRP